MKIIWSDFASEILHEIYDYYKDKAGTELQGVQIHITDFDKVYLSQIQFYFLQMAHTIDPEFDIFKGKENRYRMFDIVSGSSFIRESLMKNYRFDSIKSFWEKDIETFREKSSKYYLY